MNRIVIAVFAACALAACAPIASSPIRSSAPAAVHRHIFTPIQHVVIIVQENRSFDNLFWGFPGADSTTGCALNHKGHCVKMVASPLYESSDLNHTAQGFTIAYDVGNMDGWDIEGNGAHNPKYPYQYTQESDVQPYWQMAQTYALADEMFASQTGPSFAAHQFLVAGQTGYNDNPKYVPWGCDTPMSQGRFCYSYPTLADEMDAAGVTWRYYSNGGNGGGFAKKVAIWQAFDANRQIRYGPDWENGDVADSNNLINDIDSGVLAQVTWVTPSGVNSDHAGHISAGRQDLGPEWVTSVVDAVGQSQYWNSTAIFITWDDWGGWYDHVAPQEIYSDGLGFRVPLIAVSPYASPGYVSHVPHEFGSILHFTEETFDLPSLGTRDFMSDDLSDMFIFGDRPRKFKHIAHGDYAHHDPTAPDTDM